MKINFGCGTNKLEGWNNYDAEVDIRKPLRWLDDTIEYIFAEHVVEHVRYEQALSFFVECHRVLKPSGVCRIAVPSVTRVFQLATPQYGDFVARWTGNELDYRRRGIMNILFRHGHQAPWTEELLGVSLFYAGFDDIRACRPGQSDYVALQGIEGHGKVIGDEFNEIETVVIEATKQE